MTIDIAHTLPPPPLHTDTLDVVSWYVLLALVDPLQAPLSTPHQDYDWKTFYLEHPPRRFLPYRDRANRKRHIDDCYLGFG